MSKSDNLEFSESIPETPKPEKRQEPEHLKVIYSKDAHTGDSTWQAYEAFDYDPIYESCDSLENILADSKDPKKLLKQMARNMYKEELASTLVKIISLMIDSPNPKLELDVLVRTYNLPLRENLSDAAVARLHGICRAAFSVRVLEMCRLLNVRPPRTLKSPKARAGYVYNGSTHKLTEDEI